MKEIEKIGLLIKSLLRGSPVILGLMLAGFLIARKATQYMQPMYEATAKIKLDDNRTGISAANLYKDFDVFNQLNRIAAEEQVLRSKEMLRKSIPNLDFGISYFREGKIRKTEIYQDRPFNIQVTSFDSLLKDKELRLQVKDTNSFRLFLPKVGGEPEFLDGKFGEQLTHPLFKLTIELSTAWKQNQGRLDLEGAYSFRVNSPEKLLRDLRSIDLEVKAVDEDVPILRITFRHSVPEMAAILSNSLAETYIKSTVDQRRASAGNTLEFINYQLNEVGKRLTQSESTLESFKQKKGVINTRQETETGIRQMSELELQLANIRMREASLEELDTYINAGRNDFMDLAPNFEAFGDLLFVEMIKQVKALANERLDLLANYTPTSEKVTRIDRKIKETIQYIKESIRNSRKSCALQRQEIEKALSKSQNQFVTLPTKEKNLVILERDFQLNQKIYMFLTEKRMESEIAQAAALSFHRIIEYAEVPRNPISPRKTLLSIVAGFLGLILGICLVFLKDVFKGKIRSEAEIALEGGLPVLGILNPGESHEIASLATSLELKEKVPAGSILVISEGALQAEKMPVAKALATNFARLKKRVLLIRGSVQDELHTLSIDSIAEWFAGEVTWEKLAVSSKTEGLFLIQSREELQAAIMGSNKTQRERTLKKVSAEFDLVIIAIDMICFPVATAAVLKSAQLGIHVFHLHTSPRSEMQIPARIAAEYAADHLHLLIRQEKVAHKASLKHFLEGMLGNLRNLQRSLQSVLKPATSHA